MSYDMIDRFLRNHLDDDDYAEYSAALDSLCTPQPKQEQGEPVAITITGKLGNIYSFTGDYSLKKGDKVYTTPQQRKPLTDGQINKAAMKLAECMDYPWTHIPEEGKREMRKHAKAVIEAAYGIKE